MKILFVSTLYYPNHVGGAEATVRLLTRAAIAAGDESVVVTLSPDRGAATERLVDGIRVIYLPLANIYFPNDTGSKAAWAKLIWHAIDAFNPIMAVRLGSIIDQEKPDVISLHNIQGFSPSIWRMIAGRAIPSVQTLHDYYTGCLNSTMYRGGKNCTKPCRACATFGWSRRLYSRRVDIITAVSRRQMERLGSAGIFQGIADRRVIRGCNVPARALPKPKAAHAGKPLRLGFLGRLDPIKGLDWALDAISRFRPGAVVVKVAGKGSPDYEAKLRDRFGSPFVEYCGFVDPADWFSGIDLLLVPSLWEEPLGRVIHEAFEHGVPILGAGLGGIPEIIKDGETGFVFRGGDSADLERVLTRVLDSPPDWLAMAKACEDASRDFELGAIYGQYRETWQAALTAKRLGASDAQ